MADDGLGENYTYTLHLLDCRRNDIHDRAEKSSFILAYEQTLEQSENSSYVWMDKYPGERCL